MKTIIAATDFSKDSINAANYAAQIALDTGAKLLLLHATQLSVVSDSKLDIHRVVKKMQEEEFGEMYKLEQSILKKFPNLKLEKKIQEGFTLNVLRDLVESRNISLVVLSIRSTDSLYDALFGSTAVSVAGSLKCPVLIIPEKARFRELKKIAFAFDQKEIPTETGLSVLAELKKTYQSKMNYVNILDGIVPIKDDSSLKPIYKILSDKDPRVHYMQQGFGEVPQILSDYVRRYRPNMMVMVSRKRSLFWKIFNRRNTKRIAFQTVVPLLVLSEEGK